MRRVLAGLLLGWGVIGGAAQAEAELVNVAIDGQPLSTDRPSELLTESLRRMEVLTSGIRPDDSAARSVIVDPRGFLTFNEALDDVTPRPLADAPRALVAAFWADLHVGPCPNGRPQGQIVWAGWERGLRVSWLDMPLAGCPDGQRARFSVELAVNDAGRPVLIELIYESLPDGGDVEPRAGFNFGPTRLELLPDGPEAMVRGRAKRLVESGSERVRLPDGSLGPIIPRRWQIELGPDGMLADDPDHDGVRSADNCPRGDDPNPWQWDVDGDGDGDVCDSDADEDGAEWNFGRDNCEFTANPGQEDRDGDGIGDACDDSDGDLLVDLIDRCPDHADHAALDLDGDGVPDACDDDIDGDDTFGAGSPWFLWNPTVDLCPYVSNPARENRDGDGYQGACDLRPTTVCKNYICPYEPDDDGDGIANFFDTCPTVADPQQLDGDGDGIGDLCDGDLDDDGIPDVYTAEFRCDPMVCGRYE